jgi:serine/threonine protein kinase
MVDAIQYSHGRGVAHRDLKPENIMILRKNFQVKILDFGLLEVNSRTEVNAGTPGYMPPEFFEGRNTCGKSQDVFALGVILFNLLVGHPPFLCVADPKTDLIYQVLWQGKITEWLIMCGQRLYVSSKPTQKEQRIDYFEFMKSLMGSDSMQMLSFLFAPEPCMRLSIDEIVSIQYYDDRTQDLSQEEVSRQITEALMKNRTRLSDHPFETLDMTQEINSFEIKRSQRGPGEGSTLQEVFLLNSPRIFLPAFSSVT